MFSLIGILKCVYAIRKASGAIRKARKSLLENMRVVSAWFPIVHWEPRLNTWTSSIYNYILTKQIQAQIFFEFDHWMHWHRQKWDFLADLTSGNLFRLFKSEIMITNVRLVVLFKTSFLLLVKCLEICTSFDWSVVVIVSSYWSPVSDITMRYMWDRQLCQECQFSNNSYFLGAVRFVWTEIYSSVRSDMQSKHAEHTRQGNVLERAQSKTVHLVNNFLFIHIWHLKQFKPGARFSLWGTPRQSHQHQLCGMEFLIIF